MSASAPTAARKRTSLQFACGPQVDIRAISITRCVTVLLQHEKSSTVPATSQWIDHSKNRNRGNIVKKPSRNVVASTFGLAIVLLCLTNVQAADLKVLAGGAMTKIWVELKPKFEQSSGHKLIIRF